MTRVRTLATRKIEHQLSCPCLFIWYDFHLKCWLIYEFIYHCFFCHVNIKYSDNKTETTNVHLTPKTSYVQLLGYFIWHSLVLKCFYFEGPTRGSCTSAVRFWRVGNLAGLYWTSPNTRWASTVTFNHDWAVQRLNPPLLPLHSWGTTTRARTPTAGATSTWRRWSRWWSPPRPSELPNTSAKRLFSMWVCWTGTVFEGWMDVAEAAFPLP